MRRNKHNIQTHYRTRLFWLKNDKQNREFVITKHLVTDLLKKKKKEKKTRYKKSNEMIVSQVDSLHGIG